MFGSSIGRSVGSCKFSCKAGYSHYLSWFVFDHVREDGLDVTEGSIDIDLEKGFMILEGVLCELAPHRDSCILDKNIKFVTFFLELTDDIWCDFVDLREVGHIKFDYFDLVWEGTVAFDSF